MTGVPQVSDILDRASERLKQKLFGAFDIRASTARLTTRRLSARRSLRRPRPRWPRSSLIGKPDLAALLLTAQDNVSDFGIKTWTAGLNGVTGPQYLALRSISISRIR
jgi:hypothetical protein